MSSPLQGKGPGSPFPAHSRQWGDRPETWGAPRLCLGVHTPPAAGPGWASDPSPPALLPPTCPACPLQL